MDGSSEDQLIARLRSGDALAFKQVVDLYKDRVYNTCLGFLHNEADAEDIAQDVFVEIHQSIGQFRGESAMGTWVYRIAVTKSLAFIRKNKRRGQLLALGSFLGFRGIREDAVVFEHPGVLLENKEQATHLAAAVDRLPENQRIAFTLHKIEGLSYKEIGEIMDVSLSSVESLMHRARKNLKSHLTRYYHA